MRSALVVPVKSFARAKARLASVLDERERAALARTMAERVLAAAGPLPITVACDDDEVAAWAVEHGAAVAWAPGTDLNGAVTLAVDALDADRAVVAHADLPNARDLTVAVGDGDEVVLVPDRRRDGTNVLSIPRGAGFVFRYGVGSFERHRAEAARLGLTVVVLEPADLTWDVDEPGDLPERATCD
jgi:2-phospho-L-lactate guanylyltransferase